MSATATTADKGFVRQILRAVRDGSVEQHYSAATVAERLDVTERTVWNYVELYETSGGKEGIGPVVKVSHKVVRIPASAVNRFLRGRTIEVAAPAKEGEAA